MEEELDPEIIKATQISLGKYIKRPPLSEKLLKKPPFRFLHDIITTILKTTGFFEGVFDENELISDNVKDRDSKISFLNKVITIIGLTTGKTIPVKPSKIVAGQEPRRTNELLQCLAAALDNKLTSHEAVKKYKEGNEKQTEKRPQVKSKDLGKPNKKSHDPTKNSSKSQNLTNQKRKSGELTITKKDKEKSNDTTKRKDNGSVKNEPGIKSIQPKPLDQKVTTETKLQSQSATELCENKNSTPRIASSEEVKQKEIETNDYTNDETLDTHVSKESVNNGETIYTNEPIIASSIPQIDLKSTQAESVAEIDDMKIKLDSSNDIKGLILNTEKQVLNENIEQNTRNNSLGLEDNLPQKTQLNYLVANSVTNGSESITKPPPEPENKERLVTGIKNDSNIARSPNVRPSSSRPGAPRPKEKLENVVSDSDSHLLGKVNIIAEYEQIEEEDDSSIIIMNNEDNISNVFKDQSEHNLSTNEHGHLVQQILNSQKEFSQATGKTEIEWQLGTQKAIVPHHQEVELLRYNIQALTRVTNPLGKLLDHIQEDVEVMRQELQQWSNIYEEVSKEIHKQNALSEDSLVPLHSKLKQLEFDIQEKSEKINDLKVLIYKNSSRIEKLLSNGNVQ